MTLPSPLAGPVEALRQRPITATEKGFGPLAARHPVSAASLAAARPPLHEAGLSYPLLTLRESALTHNIDAMAAYCHAAGVGLAPHGKTTMAPQLAARQLAAGAWGITVATVGQLQTYRAFGVSRLLLANELVDPAGLSWLAAQLNADPDLEVLCYVDSSDGVAHLGRHLRPHNLRRPLPVLVELGHARGRTGARSHAEALAVAAAAARTPALSVAGVAGYEGGLGHRADPATLERVAAYCRALRALTDRLHEAGLTGDRPVLTAGGSAFFDVVVAELTADARAGAARPEAQPQVIVRSGCYVTHDHGFYAGISPAVRHTAGGLTLQPALELWAPVLSRPEPGLALLGAGRRDVSFDAGLPVPLRVRAGEPGDGRETGAAGMTVTALNDQHAYLNVPGDSGLRPGDLVCLGISHPCTTFDKWRVIPVVDEAGHVTDAIHTFF
jgi:D-serine deaminase-like pyridoxal phosphate-dependent protein